MKHILSLSIEFLFIVLIPVLSYAQSYSDFEITKVESSKGLDISGNLLNSICVGKILHEGSITMSIDYKPFNPGTGSKSGQTPTFFDFYSDGSIPKEGGHSISQRVITMAYGGIKLHWFPYRGSSNYYSPKCSEMICEANLKGKSGTISITIGKNKSIVFKVKQVNSSRANYLDLKDVLGDYYPFDIKLTTVSGTLKYNDEFRERRGQSPSVSEPVTVDLLLTRTGQAYCVGFVCSSSTIRDAKGNAPITASRREAGFRTPVQLSRGNNNIACLPARGEYHNSSIFGLTKVMTLSINTSSISFSNAAASFSPTGFVYSEEVRVQQ